MTKRHYEIRTLNGIDHKWCSLSQSFEPLRNFGKNGSRALGYHDSCSPCRTIDAREQRLMALRAYGGDTLSCNCCGEPKIEFLALDHINGGGNRHRKEVASGCSTNYYRWLKRQGWPTGYQVLCHNCNLSRGVYGYCPCQKQVANAGN